VTKTTPFAEIAADVNRDPARRARIEEYKRGMEDALALGKLLDAGQRTNGAPDRILDLAQLDKAAAERGNDLYLATLQRYVADLGGHLVVEAVFPGLRINLLRPPDAAPASETADETDTDRIASPARSSS